jgi:RNA polymerase sigma factor (TIGR02999 family)
VTDRPAARVGHLDQSNQGDARNLLRTDTPKHRLFSASADVTCAPNVVIRICVGVPDVYRTGAGKVPSSVAGGERYTGCMSDVTRLLDAATAGDRKAAADLLPLVYDELRKLAAARLAAESPDQTLQPTALVHEAYLRLIGPADERRWENRAHFFAVAAEAMRRILVDAARRKSREKHGGDWTRIDLELAQPAAPDPRHDLIALDAALGHLATVDAQAAKLVELRYFGGLSVHDAAQVLDISSRTADRVWAFARAWLHRELTGTAADPQSQ